VFAVALSANANESDPALSNIVNNPSANNFFSLSSRVKSDNDVAQRNLNIQNTTSGSGATFSSTPAGWKCPTLLLRLHQPV
jgi:hypothetical protein